ncbi:MAG: hypothetical protein GY913_24395 [Proteobacteria bacterium]|nr:hypothetical protein [Pseudomonadota bacterium]MCP4920055.1 hypothetical protein [Pseudomonadota bacterium]
MEHRERLLILGVGLAIGSLAAWWLTRATPSSPTDPATSASSTDVEPRRTRTGEPGADEGGPRTTVVPAAPTADEVLSEADREALARTLALGNGTSSSRHRVATFDEVGASWIIEGQPSDRVIGPVLAPGGREVTFQRGSSLFRWSSEAVQAVDASNGAESWTYSDAGALVFSRGGRLYTVHHDTAIELLADTPGRLTEPAYDGLTPAFVQDGERLVRYADDQLSTMAEGPIREPTHGVEWCWRVAHAAESDIACTSGVATETEKHELRPTWAGSTLVWLVEVREDSFDLAARDRTLAERVRSPSGRVGAADGWVVLASETPGVLELHHVADDRFVEFETGRADATDPTLAAGRLAFAAGPDLVVAEIGELLSAPQAGVEP